MKKQVFVSFVLYTRDECRQTAVFVSALDDFLADHFEHYEIVIVDDASEEPVEAHLQTDELHGQVLVLRLARRHGGERAILAGLDRAVGDFVFEMESADVDFDLPLLLEMFEAASGGKDVVAAASDVPPRFRQRLFYSFVNRYSYLSLDLAAERVRLVSRRALNAMLDLKEKVRYRKALYGFTGYPSTRITYSPTTGSSSRGRRLNRETVKLAFDILISFSEVGLRLANLFSLMFLFFSLAGILYTVLNYLFNDNLIVGWPTIMIVLSTGLAGIFFVLGLIGEYVARMLIEVRQRPNYAVATSHTFLPAPPVGRFSGDGDSEDLATDIVDHPAGGRTPRLHAGGS